MPVIRQIWRAVKGADPGKQAEQGFRDSSVILRPHPAAKGFVVGLQRIELVLAGRGYIGLAGQYLAIRADIAAVFLMASIMTPLSGLINIILECRPINSQIRRRTVHSRKSSKASISMVTRRSKPHCLMALILPPSRCLRKACRTH